MAVFQLFSERYYVYIDADCPGINRGYVPINCIIVNAILFWIGKSDFIELESMQVL